MFNCCTEIIVYLLLVINGIRMIFEWLYSHGWLWKSEFISEFVFLGCGCAVADKSASSSSSFSSSSSSSSSSSCSSIGVRYSGVNYREGLLSKCLFSLRTSGPKVCFGGIQLNFKRSLLGTKSSYEGLALHGKSSHRDLTSENVPEALGGQPKNTTKTCKI